MHYTALQNYSVSAAHPPAPAQRAPAMAAFTAISASSGELMVPENAGVVIQAKSGINAIRVSGTATTTAGLTGPGTTSNQIQFYSNDTIVGAFDRLGLYTGSVYIGSSNQFVISKGAGSLLGNIVIGDSTAGNNLTGAGTNNVIIGANNAGSKITTGSANVAIGWGSMGNGVTTGNINTCVGASSGFNLTSGNLNTLIGQNAGGNMTSGYRNVGLGAGALGAGLNTGINNIGVGVDAGGNITSGYDNICIGRATNLASNENNNEIVIGAGKIGNGSNTTTIANRVYTDGLICSAGNSLYLNNPANTYSWSFKTDASNILHLVNQYGTDYMMCRDDMGVVHTQPTRTYSAGAIGSSGYIGTSSKGGGCPSLVLANDAAASNYNDLWSTGNFNIGFSDGKTLYASKGTGVWTYTSDFNLKTNIVSLSSTLQNILNLNPVNFNYKTEPNAPPIAGFIAQEVQTNFPLLVSRNILPDGTEDPYLSLSQTGLIPYIVKAIQEQHQEIMDLKSQLNELKSILNKLVK